MPRSFNLHQFYLLLPRQMGIYEAFSSTDTLADLFSCVPIERKRREKNNLLSKKLLVIRIHLLEGKKERKKENLLLAP
jgi:hypothetical protein